MTHGHALIQTNPITAYERTPTFQQGMDRILTKFKW